ncbi:MAG: hypothetical protein AAB458_02700 [Patescibacteria group bacterium]
MKKLLGWQLAVTVLVYALTSLIRFYSISFAFVPLVMVITLIVLMACTNRSLGKFSDLPITAAILGALVAGMYTGWGHKIFWVNLVYFVAGGGLLLTVWKEIMEELQTHSLRTLGVVLLGMWGASFAIVNRDLVLVPVSILVFCIFMSFVDEILAAFVKACGEGHTFYP